MMAKQFASLGPLFLILVTTGMLSARAQDKLKEDPLADRQKQVAEQLQRLESLLLRSADIEAIDNPTRAALLQQAAQLSKQTDLSTLLENASKNIRSNQLSDAIDQQKASRDGLNKLLELLQSENREKRVREQRDQVRRWIEDADRLLRMQSSLRGRTEGGQDLNRAAEDQSRLTDKAEQISKDLGGDSSKESSANSSSKKSSDAAKPNWQEQTDKSNERPKSDGGKLDSDKPDSQQPEKSDSNQPNESNKKDGSESTDKNSQQSPDSQNNAQQGQPQQGQSQQGQPQQGQPQQGQPQQGQPQQGQPQQGQPQQGQPQQGEKQQGQSNDKQPEPKTPTERAQQQIQQAQQRMKEAQQQLKDAQRQGAIEKQREAEENLKQAIQQLEEILKQLREEEIKRSLETLSTRIRRMLEMQNKIYEESQRLNEIAGENPDRQILARANSLSLEQKKVAAEGERALLLLKEEGSSAAFPEALEQVNRDAVAVANRLDAGDVGKITLVIQGDIVQALEEMVEALAKIKKENDDKKQQRQQQGGGGGGQPDQNQPLINKLAELRLIRTLQLRVNKRTTTLSQMLENPADPIGQAKAKDVMEQLQDLSKRQDNIETVTRKVAAEN